jgi:outer membrane protein insertion porin family
LRQRSEITIRLLWICFVIAATGCAGWQPSRMAYRPSFQQPQSYGATGIGNELASTTPAARGANIVRGQDSQYSDPLSKQDPGSSQFMRHRMPVTQAQYAPATAPSHTASAPYSTATVPTESAPAQPLIAPGPQEVIAAPPGQPYVDIDPTMSTPLDVFVEETQTGRFMFGAGVNSDAGVTGQIVIDERNFDITRVPTSFQDFVNGTAFRGAGQGFRLEAMPGNLVQRYLISFTEPYLFNTRVSFNSSGFLYDRRFYDWDERRAGGRLALGYRLRPDLSFTAALRGENVKISDPRVVGAIQPAELTEVLGRSELYSGRFTLTHDTRDIPFSPTVGHLVELSYEQVFGDFDYPRGELDYRRYFIIRERPDGSGRHTLGFNFRAGFSGSHTPLFENYFAGGFSTLRGFDFRGASPVDPASGVRLGGVFRFLGSAEYIFPLTADDMLKGALFVDFGTVEQNIQLNSDNYRVAPGFGVRINVPALGPAPLAFDFAFPVVQADTDETQNFSFFMGVGR